uniref:Uncharacterized protein n=1 Tax=Meloidogyne enterolobii TaxID=390850 RepID=A0A6V7U3W8_MELEN|nr:unnamed protein product [Meloidogyne enterolobii]
MIMKVLLLYPDTNFIELIERFFLTYSTWLGYLILRKIKIIMRGRLGQIEVSKSKLAQMWELRNYIIFTEIIRKECRKSGDGTRISDPSLIKCPFSLVRDILSIRIL